MIELIGRWLAFKHSSRNFVFANVVREYLESRLAKSNLQGASLGVAASKLAHIVSSNLHIALLLNARCLRLWPS